VPRQLRRSRYQLDDDSQAAQKGNRGNLPGKCRVLFMPSHSLENGKWERDGYIGLFAIANLTPTERGLEFDLTQRLASLK
jgi:hypothetical protein